MLGTKTWHTYRFPAAQLLSLEEQPPEICWLRLPQASDCSGFDNDLAATSDASSAISRHVATGEVEPMCELSSVFPARHARRARTPRTKAWMRMTAVRIPAMAASTGRDSSVPSVTPSVTPVSARACAIASPDTLSIYDRATAAAESA